MARAIVNVPKQAKKGESVEIKVLISHPMESGFRHDAVGKPIPRHIIKHFVCTWNGQEVFRAELFPAISANPYLVFRARAEQSGTIELTWTDDKGAVETARAEITVA